MNPCISFTFYISKEREKHSGIGKDAEVSRDKVKEITQRLHPSEIHFALSTTFNFSQPRHDELTIFSIAKVFEQTLSEMNFNFDVIKFIFSSTNECAV